MYFRTFHSCIFTFCDSCKVKYLLEQVRYKTRVVHISIGGSYTKIYNMIVYTDSTIYDSNVYDSITKTNHVRSKNHAELTFYR